MEPPSFGADKEIQRSSHEWDQDELNKRLIKDEISCHFCPRSEWRFQPPSASHMSGVWETLIRSVLKSMSAIFGNQNALVGLETLRTVFALLPQAVTFRVTLNLLVRVISSFNGETLLYHLACL